MVIGLDGEDKELGCQNPAYPDDLRQYALGKIGSQSARVEFSVLIHVTKIKFCIFL